MNGQSNQKQRLCDYCDGSTALLYCRADSAKLCLSCDREVHSTSPLFVKHSRSQLCDACDEAPASVFCETERWVLCQNCDWETHKPSLSPPHNRRLIEGFSGCPSVSELLGFVGFEDLGNKALASGEEKLGSGVAGDTSFDPGFDGLLDLFVCETPTVASLDDLIVLNGSNHRLQATDIPPLPKDRNVTCGQYKEEILCQLRELAKTEANLNNENTSIEANMQSLIPDCYLQPKDYGRHEHDVVPISLRAYESGAFKGFGDSIEVADSVFPSPFPSSSLEENAMVPDKHINIGCQSSHQISSQDDQSQDHVATGTSSGVRKVPLYDMNSQERETAISRYKEKKRTRRYEKHIRYESRKLRAEGRTRIRGRFAKVEP